MMGHMIPDFFMEIKQARMVDIKSTFHLVYFIILIWFFWSVFITKKTFVPEGQKKKSTFSSS